MLKNSNILITGGTGSFGRKATEILLREYKPKRIVIYSRDEFKQSEMAKDFTDKRLRYFIGDVRDRDRLKLALNGIDYVFHAAALKRIDSCEYSPTETISTNITGSRNVFTEAMKVNVKKVMFISTDKATAPTSLYGVTKLCSEKLATAFNVYSGKNGTRFSSLRYGNVVCSRGSVIPLFKKQYRQNKEITITDDEMTRFFIKLEDAVRFSISCLEMMLGGEVFIPKIKSCKVIDLAKAVVGPDCTYKIVGIRPGEKLHESMISKHESLNTIELNDRFVILPTDFPHWSFERMNGEKVERGFEYSSNKNCETYTTAELKHLES